MREQTHKSGPHFVADPLAAGHVGAASCPRFDADLIAEPGRSFVIFAGDGFVELFAESLFDREVLADFLLEHQELLSMRRLIGHVVGFCVRSDHSN